VRPEHLAQRLVHEMGDRMVAHRALAARRFDARLDPVADLQRARPQRAMMAEYLGLDLLRILDREGARRAHDFAVVADLPADSA